MKYLDQTGLAYFWGKIKTYTTDSIGNAVDTVGNHTINGHKINTNPVLNKSDIGLSNVTNDAQVKRTEMGAANGVATLGSDSKIPAAQLPSYVDDVLEYDNKSAFPKTGELGKIYVAKDTNLTYRWSGTTYVEISQSLALGETSSTAYAGDKGKANRAAISSLPDHIVSNVFINTAEITSDKIPLHVSRSEKKGLNYAAAVDGIYNLLSATASTAGLMSATDKSRTNSLWTSALASIAVDPVTLATNAAGNQGTVTLKLAKVAGGSATNVPFKVTIPLATGSANGVMSSADKTKLDALMTGDEFESQLGKYLPLAGGTLSGELYVKASSTNKNSSVRIGVDSHDLGSVAITDKNNKETIILSAGFGLNFVNTPEKGYITVDTQGASNKFFASDGSLQIITSLSNQTIDEMCV